MSTFGGLNTAYTGLVAARQGLNTVGQNIANANTDGYTRQRVTTSSIAATAQTGAVANAGTVGQGVSVDGVARFGSAQLDAGVRTSAGAAGYSAVRANTLAALETSLNEPGDSGLSAKLGEFWSGWQTLANGADDPTNGSLLLETAGQLATQISQGYSAVENQWASARNDLSSMAEELNGAASQVASLNTQIRSALASGGSANELIDQRSQLTTTIAALTGASVRDQADGTVTVVIGGNALVSGDFANALSVSGATSLDGLDANPVSLTWASGTTVSIEGGEMAGSLSLLGSANDSGTGGVLAEAAASYNSFAGDLADKVNAIYTSAGADNLFSYTAGSAASTITVAATTVVAGDPDAGAYDGSIADAVAQLGAGEAVDADGAAIVSPSDDWATFVTQIGVVTQSALQGATIDDAAATSAVGRQLANASVDMDEENVNLLMFQTAYQGAARMLTAVDEMLDTLINRTGLVGR
ncbi:flagellar hook-associated protein FlgK [Cryobacterium melibiosiphilum]|uniref:Flagellar hook-associated protein 1 n=1 Tax=Cryobacterium melibiosiphilum TaxID=995039 RepID=A0A3A5MQ51_9MICO|nr:flagellar hook-associated protein FlgK [Cryobacterium melibiosiphilum]RJT88196.1 flagellar hook-associated protein FlgK [Cryobacterium melibiosiphilum]